MKVDTTYPNATAASNEQARVRSTLRQIEPPEVQDGATVRISVTAGASRTARVSDSAQISSSTISVGALAVSAKATPDVRQARVEAIRLSLEQGTYEMSPQRIAEAMLAQATSKLR